MAFCNVLETVKVCFVRDRVYLFMFVVFLLSFALVHIYDAYLYTV